LATKTQPILSRNAQVVACMRYLNRPDIALEGEEWKYLYCENCQVNHSPTDYKICEFCEKHHETVQQMFERVSFGNDDYYELMANLDFLPNSPTLFNAGLENAGTFSACFRFQVEDSMVAIMDVATKAAMVQKWGGGVGYYLGEVRSKDSPIKTTHGKACGPVAVMRHFQSVANLITQGGKRRGAQMGILPIEHPDVIEFIHCKDEDSQALDTFNISVSVSNEFMRAATIVGTDEAKLLDQIAESAWKTGDPGLYFRDTAEDHNPTPEIGKLDGTNPCGEVPLLDNEPCNLGSINLNNFIYDEDGIKVFDYDRLSEITQIAVRFLDEILDHNTFPDPRIDFAARRTRKLGLGVMGWADTLATFEIDYDTNEAVEFGRVIMSSIQIAAHRASKELAKEKGFLIYEPLEDLRLDRRNATLTCIAPTGTIAILADASSGIEPHYALENTRTTGEGVELIEKVVYGSFVPKTSKDIDWRWHIDHQSAFQMSTDLAVSKTINMPNDVNADDVRSAYVYAWKSDCKGITIYRDRSRDSQVLVSVEDIVKETFTEELVVSKETSTRRRLGDDVPSLRHHFRVDELEGYLHVGQYEDGKPGELFICCSKQGSTLDGLMDTIAILTSLSLQSGVSLETVVDKLRGRRFEPSGMTSNPSIPTASSVIDYIARYLEATFLGGTNGEHKRTGMLCPECSKEVVNLEGCLICTDVVCGWSRC
jgi:ribonucleoside-diphosphate reductase alpha chain